VTFNASRGGLTAAAEYYGGGLAGVEPFPRWAAGAAKATGNGVLYLTYLTPSQSYPATSLSIVTGGAAGATPTLCRMGVYTIDAAGAGALVAAIANDTTLFAAGATKYARNFSAGGGLPTGYAYQAGQRYAHGVLILSAAAFPTLKGVDLGAQSGLFALAPRLFGQLTGQVDLPTSFVAASLATTQDAAIWIGAI
jgi:hypothetical protein